MKRRNERERKRKRKKILDDERSTKIQTIFVPRRLLLDVLHAVLVSSLAPVLFSYGRMSFV